MKQELMEKLIELLEHESKVYEDILRLSKDKTNIIVKGKVSGLENIVKLEQALVLQVSRIDKQREQLVVEFVHEIRSGENNLSISDLKKYANQEHGRRLEEYQSKMNGLVKELNHVNQLNSKLIKNSLDFIEFTLNIMSNADLTSNNYGNKGDSSKTERKNLFDMKL